VTSSNVSIYIDFRYVHIDIPNFRYTSLFTRSQKILCAFEGIVWPMQAILQNSDY
jgi:hypothetical protein